MDVFISWSGDKSRKAAEVLRDWLPSVIQAVTPYYTPKDIDKGQRWSNDIAGKLNVSHFGVILVTRENLNAPWILFEAGALSKNVGFSHVCPILLDLKPTDLSGPLVQFQATAFSKDEMKTLIAAINDALGDNRINEKNLDNIFEKWWPDLEQAVEKIILEDYSKDETEEIRSDRDLLEEVLRLVRKHEYRSFDSGNRLLDKLNHKHVSYSESNKTITIWLGETSPYEIHLDQIGSGSQLLDFILQVNRKGRSKPEHIKGFLDCIEELSDRYFKTNAQGVFCPLGTNKSVEWPEE
ncbi:hypothetical protein CWE12_13145 [Aliidiomarina sedimenti]|uniref:TIR domain-containing protein n=1 Tax=Aliidiomarina sedimenti TaxID=1933879 RepID=A0ABY0BUW7_9GAMM|nr:TIR domain-containing protein [Aliidiomarina sedimenti]RUO27877.1 hypothetical protein CWE12_13145 [Aliidiomarina sedimenti]